MAWSFGTVIFCAVALLGISHWLFAPRTERFAAYAQVRESQLIEKGWIPAFLPRDAFDIVHLHDLDNNSASTEYSYSNDAHGELGAQWQPVSPESAARCRKDAVEHGWSMQEDPQMRCFVRGDGDSIEFLAVDAGSKRALHWHTPR